MSMDKYTGVNCIRKYPMQYTTSTLRFTDKDNNECERQLYSNMFREQIDLYGQKILYYRNLYNTLSADNIYGEMPLQKFETPKSFVMAIRLSENALILSKFGYQSDDQLTAYVHVSSFYSVYPPDVEPKAGDVFQLTEYGSDRPGERNGKMFEITERVDEDNSQINPLMGHYVWMLKAKRFDYSFEPNITFEKGSTQVQDSIQYGTLSAAISNAGTTTVRGSAYPYDADTVSKNLVFDMDKNNTLEYGGYY
jgi:hypothetical protein